MAVAKTISNLFSNPLAVMSQSKAQESDPLAVMSQSKAQESNSMAVMSQTKAQETSASNNLNTPLKNASGNIQKHSFLFGIYQDVVKSLWKILTGVFAVETVKGVLKDKNFTPAKVIDQTLRTDFALSFGAYLGGAWGVRLFDGTKSILGIRLPKLPSVMAGHVISNHIAKAIGGTYATEFLNRDSAISGNEGELEAEIGEVVKNSWFMRLLGQINRFYNERLKDPTTKVLSTVFGVSRDRETDEAKINWGHFFGVSGLVGLATWFLPKETQVYGMEDISNSKGIKKLLHGLFYFAFSLLSRFDDYVFHNAITLHREGYGFEECMRSAIRDKTFPPLLQNAFDVVSGYMQSLFPNVNGAMLASMVTLPIDIIGAYLSADLVGIAKETRVPPVWTYLGNKIWKPLAGIFEEAVAPLFTGVIKPLIYQSVLKMFPNHLEGRYRELEMHSVPKHIRDEFESQNTIWLLIKESFGIIPHIPKMFKEATKEAMQAKSPSPEFALA